MHWHWVRENRRELTIRIARYQVNVGLYLLYKSKYSLATLVSRFAYSLFFAYFSFSFIDLTIKPSPHRSHTDNPLTCRCSFHALGSPHILDNTFWQQLWSISIVAKITSTRGSLQSMLVITTYLIQSIIGKHCFEHNIFWQKHNILILLRRAGPYNIKWHDTNPTCMPTYMSDALYTSHVCCLLSHDETYVYYY